MATNTDDKGYRKMLSNRRNFCDFVKNHIIAPWTEQLDAESLELVNTRFVTKDFKGREADIIYRARIGRAIRSACCAGCARRSKRAAA